MFFIILLLLKLFKVIYTVKYDSPMCKTYNDCECKEVEIGQNYQMKKIHIRCENNKSMIFLENDRHVRLGIYDLVNITLTNKIFENYPELEFLTVSNSSTEILNEDLIKGSQ